MLKELHKSKISFCEIEDKKWEKPDYIFDNVVTDVKKVQEGDYHKMDNDELFEYFLSDEVVAEARQAQAKRMQQLAHAEALKENPGKRIPAAQFAVDPESIAIEDLVFRALCYEHIPEELERKKTHKTVADRHTKLNFIPFKQYAVDNGKMREVGKSHYKNGEFTVTGGSITNELAKMFMLLVNRYAERSNWRGYTYLDEMKGQALLQLSHMGLRFEEAKSDNPFAYFTAVLSNSFTRVLNIEKKNQDLRDNLLETVGQMPSFNRQLKYEEIARQSREDTEDHP